MVIAIFVNRAYQKYAWGYNFPIWTKSWLTRQKLFPLPTVRAPSASNGPSALSWIMSWYITGPHNLRSFLAANSTQNFFLIAHRFSFLWHSQQKCWINILGQNDTIFDIGNGEGGNKEKIRKYREWISLHFLILSPFSISLFSLHFIFIFSFPLHFLAAMRKKFLVKFARESSASCEGLSSTFFELMNLMIYGRITEEIQVRRHPKSMPKSSPSESNIFWDTLYNCIWTIDLKLMFEY